MWQNNIMEQELPHEAAHAIKRSDILAGSLALLCVGLTMLLGPQWGWPFIVAGVGGLAIYFAMWRDKRPSWIGKGLAIVLLLFVLTSASLLGWKFFHPVLSPSTASLPAASVLSARALAEAIVVAEAEHKRSYSVRDRPHAQKANVPVNANKVSSQNGPAVGSIDQHQAPCSGGIAIGGGTANGGNCGPPQRTIPADKRDGMIDILRSKPASVELNGLLGDQESVKFAAELYDALHDAGWQMKGIRVGKWIAGTPPKGVRLIMNGDGVEPGQKLHIDEDSPEGHLVQALIFAGFPDIEGNRIKESLDATIVVNVGVP